MGDGIPADPVTSPAERGFCFRLAAALGYTVAELLARIPARELAAWMDYEERLGPAAKSGDEP